jgi:hypothetical protein
MLRICRIGSGNCLFIALLISEKAVISTQKLYQAKILITSPHQHGTRTQQGMLLIEEIQT